VKDGLSQGSVICIFQDSQGFMWFGTQDGLNRYDGYTLKVFKKDPAEPGSLNDNFIVSIAEDSSRTLWVGTLNAPTTLNRFDPLTETFAQVPRDSVDLFHARIGAARPEYLDHSGTRWSGSIGGGLTRLDLRTGRKTVYKHDPSNPSSLADDRVYSVVGDRSGLIWLGTREGLCRFDPRTESFVTYRHDPKDSRTLSDSWVWPILEDRNGTLWIGTFRGGLNRLDRNPLNRNEVSFTRFLHDEGSPRSIAGDRLYALAEDRSGAIWLGLGDQGVDRFLPGMSAFRHYRNDPSNPSSLIDNNVTSLFVDGNGTAWIGTRSGLNRLDIGSGTLLRTGIPREILNDVVQSFCEDRRGDLWFGTLSNGLIRYERKRGRVTRYLNDPAKPGSLSDNRVYALLEDRTEEIWIGTYGGGLNRFDRETGTFQTFRHTDSSGPGAEGVWSLLEDGEGMLWIGTYGGGLDRYDRATGTFVHHRHDEKNAESLSDDLVLSLFQDRTGTLWVGTTGGLNRYDRNKGAFRSYREKDGLPNDVVFGILGDKNGNLWMSTNKGIARLDPGTGTFRSYGFADGLQGDEFNQGAFAQDSRSGELLFGGANGFNIFHPDSVRSNQFVPPVVFSGFIRYNTDDAEGRPIVEKGMGAKPEITLSYKDNVATFEFAALSFYNSLKNRYAYRLEGYSENWIQLGTERKATFTNLDGGEYLLRVKGSNNDGVWNEEGTSLRLTVTPPWWKTKWAYASYALMVLGFLYGARRFEMNQREQKAKMRESELHAKAVEAEKRALQAENERQTKELEDARKLQLSMLPKVVPEFPGYDIAVFMRTATEVGGDYYDFTRGEESMLNVAIGDATGHGMQAGTIVTLMKGLFLSDASRLDITAFFNRCSRAIKEIRMGRLFMAFTLVKLKGNSVSLSSAGMPPAYLYRKNDGSVEEILLKGMPLGAMENFPYLLHETEMRSGDVLLLLTDGLPEQKNTAEEMFDYARVQHEFAGVATRSPDDIIAHLVKAGESWMNGANQEDDITFLVLKKKE